MDLKTTQSLLREILEKSGSSNFWHCIEKLKKERVNPMREKRRKFTDEELAKKWAEQQDDVGMCLCGICENESKPLQMKMMTNGKPKFINVAMDHKDPNRLDFNAWDNLQLAHDIPCNREKAAKSMLQQSKERGKTFRELA